jgi:AraC-like DNA-binding protein
MRGLNETRIREQTQGAVLADAFAASATVSVATSVHARHATMVLIGLDADVTVTGARGAAARGRVVIVPPDIVHTAVCPGPNVGLLYDPELAPAIATRALDGRGRTFALGGREAAWLLAAVTSQRAALGCPDVLAGMAHEAAARIAGPAPTREPDRRVAMIIQSLRDDRPLSLKQLMSESRFSAAHLRDLFRRDIGVPMRRFALWHRTMRALGAFSRMPATRAAHDAGFADLAHFSRTCRQMLGDSPSGLGRKRIAS